MLNAVSLDYAVLGLCERKHLLDYVENFVFYYKDTVKIAAKNHQFLGVNNAIDNFKLRSKHDAEGTDAQNKGKLGVFWHTQGSGKSYSMVFFARKVFRQFTGNYTFLIVTDREDLDGQIYRNFLHAEAFTKSTKCQPKNSSDFRDMLQTNTRYIFTLIQKFRFDKGKQYPILSERNDIIVIIDEAHRTQYKDLAENMRIGLPNAQYMAFTGTPLFGSKKLTNDWFGKTVSEYDFKQSLDDGATVPLFYHKRVPSVLMQNDDINKDFADIVSDEKLTTEEQTRLEREFAQELSVIKADDRLEIIDKYNAGITTKEDYFDELVDFFQQMKDEDKRAYREGLTEAELEIFDLLKKDNLAKEEEQKVKLADKSLLIRLREERPTVLINDWHKDTQTKLQVELAIKKVLDEHLPVSYDRAIYSTKCTNVYNHFLTMAQNGQYRAYG